MKNRFVFARLLSDFRSGLFGQQLERMVAVHGDLRRGDARQEQIPNRGGP